MVKKLFALASITTLTGLVAATGAAGCTTTEVVEQSDDAGTGEGGKGPKKNPNPIDDDDDDGDDDDEEIPSKTVGKECSNDDECVPEGTDSINFCSKGNFHSEGGDDLYGTPVCVGLCAPAANPKTVADYLCDGEQGLCIPAGGGQGLCLGLCAFDATKVIDACAGNNKCTPGLSVQSEKGEIFGLGYCWGACTQDSDCKGTAGQKCQAELGTCVAEKHHVAFKKDIGEVCDRTKVDECACRAVGGTGPDKDVGFCTHTCLTGAAGDTLCGSKKAGWKCSAGLAASGDFAFTGQPDDILGECMQPCSDDTDCADLAAETELDVACADYAGGKFCDVR